jgi:hypothetical protein
MRARHGSAASARLLATFEAGVGLLIGVGFAVLLTLLIDAGRSSSFVRAMIAPPPGDDDLALARSLQLVFGVSGLVRVSLASRAATDRSASDIVLRRVWGTALVPIALFAPLFDPLHPNGPATAALGILVVIVATVVSRVLFLGVVRSARKARALASFDRGDRIVRAHALWVCGTFALAAVSGSWRPQALVIATCAAAAALAGEYRIRLLDREVDRIRSGAHPSHELRPIGDCGARPLRARDANGRHGIFRRGSTTYRDSAAERPVARVGCELGAL